MTTEVTNDHILETIRDAILTVAGSIFMLWMIYKLYRRWTRNNYGHALATEISLETSNRFVERQDEMTQTSCEELNVKKVVHRNNRKDHVQKCSETGNLSLISETFSNIV